MNNHDMVIMLMCIW